MTIEELLQLIPEDQREEAQETIKGLNPLDGLKNADEAAQFIESTDILKRGNDKLTSKAVERNRERLEKEWLPEKEKELRDQVYKELNPEETPEQKRVRELEQRLQEREKTEQQYQRREKLRAKAKELGFDEDLAERFAYMQTDDPETELATFAERFQKGAESKAEQLVNERWPGGRPKKSPNGSGKITSIDQVPEDWTQEDVANAIEAGKLTLE